MEMRWEVGGFSQPDAIRPSLITQPNGLASWTDGDGAIEVCTHGLGLCTTSIDVVMSRLSHNLTLRKMGNQ